MILSAAAIATACSKSPGGGEPGPTPGKPPVIGQTEFVSADAQNGERTQQGPTRDLAGAPADSREGGGNTRTVEQGDIYRVASNGRILNLNAYRGLQIIDVSDPRNPRIEGKLGVTGTPVEMYQVGNRVYVLLNNWRGYYGTREDVRPQTFEGGLVLAVDVTNPTAPIETGRATVPGWIRTSRLTRGGGQEALFVVATNGDHTTVKSFQVSSQGALQARSELDLGGYVSDAQATPDRLLVARNDWGRTGGRSEVAIIDIGDPTGAMTQGANILVSGQVNNKFNMDIRGNVLRVVSSNSWGNAQNTNHAETFDVTDIQSPTPIDHDTFGDNEQLFGTLWLEGSAFFVTYERRDPFHAFAIDAAGQMQEMSQFIVSGWNDYFRSVAGDTRLVGIGKNDQMGQTLAVSLYDITNLSNPNPLITRAEIDLEWAWSEANWDDRAFSILENATSIAAQNGTIETGLVLLPFSGWDNNSGYRSGVQIFTFSDSTLTKRGLMEQSTPVRRSFVQNQQNATTGNLSEEELSLFNTSNPNTPVELSRLELAPNYSSVLVFGSHGVRRHSKDYYTRYWGNHQATLPNDELEIVSLAGDVDAASPLATIQIRGDARAYKIGNKLAVVALDMYDQGDPSQNRAPAYETTITSYDLSNPTSPQLAGTLTTRALPSPSYYYYGGPIADCFDCGRGWYWYGQDESIKAVGNALVFVNQTYENELEGTDHVRYIYPANPGYEACWDSTTSMSQACTYYTGSINCTRLVRNDGTIEPEVCYGDIYQCNQTAAGESTCNPVDASTVQTTESTYTNEHRRYWTHYDFHGVDLSGTPALGGTVQMARTDEGGAMVISGTSLYVTYKNPIRVPGDPRPFVRYYFKAIDWANPANPTNPAGINIPGELVAVDGNGIVTRDFLWGQSIVESSIDKLEVAGGLAHLRAIRVFSNRVVEKVKLDGQGHVLVSHGQAWTYGGPSVGVARPAEDGGAGRGIGSGAQAPQPVHKLTVLDFVGQSLSQLSEVDVDAWATLEGGIAGRALFTVPGGLLVVNLDNASAPYAQAYFPVNGWSNQIALAGRDALFAAGRFGLYKFNLDAFNLLQPTN